MALYVTAPVDSFMALYCTAMGQMEPPPLSKVPSGQRTRITSPDLHPM